MELEKGPTHQAGVTIEIGPAASGDAMAVTLGGDLTFPHAACIREKLLAAFGAAQRVRLEFSKVREIDLSFPQLLCAACHTALAEGKEFALGPSEPPPLVRELARKAGFEDRSCCPDACGCWLPMAGGAAVQSPTATAEGV